MVMDARTIQTLGATMVGDPLVITTHFDQNETTHVEGFVVAGGRVDIQEVRLYSREVKQDLRELGIELDFAEERKNLGDVLLADYLATLAPERVLAASNWGALVLGDSRDNIASQLATRHVRRNIIQALNQLRVSSQSRPLLGLADKVAAMRIGVQPQ